MIEVKEAVEAAFAYFQDLFRGEYQNLSLEEVELSNDEQAWWITLGYNLPASNIAMMAGATGKRVYKIFEIESDTGKVKSMKIRDVSNE